MQCNRPEFNPWVRMIPWRRKWLHTPVVFPGEFHGERRLEGFNTQGHKELDTTEHLILFTEISYHFIVSVSKHIIYNIECHYICFTLMFIHLLIHLFIQDIHIRYLLLQNIILSMDS